MQLNTGNTKRKIQLGLGQRITKGVAVLCTISFVVFFVTQARRDFFYPILGFVPTEAIAKGMLWQFLTAIFMHVNLSHLFFNMIALYMFGCPVEKEMGLKNFIIYFLICGIGGFLLTYLLWLFGLIPNAVFVGMSSAVYGFLLAFSLLYRNCKSGCFLQSPFRRNGWR